MPPTDRSATKPLEDRAAEPIRNASRTRRVLAPAQRRPGAHSIMDVRTAEPALRPVREPQLTITEPFDPHSRRRRATVWSNPSLAHRRGPAFRNLSVEIVHRDAALKTLC